ncbi:hypothetical protein K493DRAFT_303683 [Basidiobolus meristosporus CBS 931.73]|uniref:Uncharacterized protein n=1 Tax=Basidiobolus meristosporus CBS 931.73 TaxID=1314790 RepID=A0A1Y1Y1X1_9FUNG|nr:hypothetical protein K493DRAFT_303683 [Basidiobolus meristosporus CBS 931.73]|eukprot:ORX91949.1 hypothetical protein K493DRAFT_303683 [Basidiobolus meristosporus CBS 931.73]
MNSQGTGEFDFLYAFTEKAINQQIQAIWSEEPTNSLSSWDNTSLNVSEDELEVNIYLEAPIIRIQSQGQLLLTFKLKSGSKVCYHQIRSATEAVEVEEDIGGLEFSFMTNVGTVPFIAPHIGVFDETRREKLTTFQNSAFSLHSVVVNFDQVELAMDNGKKINGSISSMRMTISHLLVRALKLVDESEKPLILAVIATKSEESEGSITPVQFFYSTSVAQNPDQSTVNILMNITNKAIETGVNFSPEVVRPEEDNVRARLFLSGKLAYKVVGDVVKQAFAKVGGAEHVQELNNGMFEVDTEALPEGTERLACRISFEAQFITVEFEVRRSEKVEIGIDLAGIEGTDVIQCNGKRTNKYKLEITDTSCSGLEFSQQSDVTLEFEGGDAEVFGENREKLAGLVKEQLEEIESTFSTLMTENRINDLFDSILSQTGFDFVLLPGNDTVLSEEPGFFGGDYIDPIFESFGLDPRSQSFGVTASF